MEGLVNIDVVSLLLAIIMAGTSWGSAVNLAPPSDSGVHRVERIRLRDESSSRDRGRELDNRADLERIETTRAVRAGREVGADDLEWRPLGPRPLTMLDWAMSPVSGRVSAIAVNPVDENVIYLGAASGGVWKTLDGGVSWTPIFDDVGAQTISAIALDPSDPDVVWVGAGGCTEYFDEGLFRSADGGATWEARNGDADNLLKLTTISGLLVHPTIPHLLFAGGEGLCSLDPSYNGNESGVYRSMDDGGTWTKVLSGRVYDLQVDPETPTTIYAAVALYSNVYFAVYKSTDAGLTWTAVFETWDGSGNQVRLAIAPGDTTVLYVLYADPQGPEATCLLCRSTDGGASWTLQNSNACEGGWNNHISLAASPTDPERVVAGSIGHYTSTDGGVTLVSRTEPWGPSQTVHQDTEVLVHSAIHPDRYWIGTGGGIWRTDDGGGHFTNLNATLNITQLNDIAVRPDVPEIVFAGADENSSCRSTGSGQWEVTEVTGDGHVTVIDPGDPETVFQLGYPMTYNDSKWPTIYRSTAGGAPSTFELLWPLSGIGSQERWNTINVPIAIARPDGGPSWLVMASNFAYRALVASPSEWHRISGDLTQSLDRRTADAIATATDGDDTVAYIGTGDGEVTRCDGLTGPDPVCTRVTGNFPGGWITDLAADPSNPSRVFLSVYPLGTRPLLYRSTAGGTDWVAVGNGLPKDPANTVAVDPRNPKRIFVGTTVGVFVSRDGGDSFVPAMTGLPLGLNVNDLEVSKDPYILTAGTYGRGAWRTSLALFFDGFETGDTTEWGQ